MRCFKPWLNWLDDCNCSEGIMSTSTEVIEQLANTEYKYGFVTDVEQDIVPKGLSEDVVRLISAKKDEPEWLLEWRLKAYRAWLKMTEPTWQNVKYDADRLPEHQLLRGAEGEEVARQHGRGRSGDPRDVRQARHPADRAAAARRRRGRRGLRLGVGGDDLPREAGEARDHLLLVLGSGARASRAGEAVSRARSCRYTDNFFAALNSAVFSDGSFVYVPKGVRCPMELSTYFRINAKDTGQFERTLIVCDEGATVSYLEGCTAPKRDENQLHAAVVELVALDNATIKYSTVQNWYPGDKQGKGGIYNFVTKRGLCKGRRSKITWTQVETGSAITWKYPSCILQGDDSVGEFYSVAVTNNYQQADTGTKMIHLGKNTRSTIVSKGISAGRGQNTYRGAVKIGKNAAQRAQLLAVRFAAHRRSLRRAHVPVSRDQEHVGERRARSLDVEDRRGPDLLLRAARHREGRRDQHDRQRVLQGSVPRAADGVRGRSAEAAGHFAGRVGRLKDSVMDIMSMLEVRNLQSEGGGQADPPRRQPHGQHGRGARHHGAERLGQEHARARAGRPSRLRGHRRRGAATRARICSTCRPTSARAKACSWRSSIRSRFPASTTPIS